jgi:hypothetical protein
MLDMSSTDSLREGAVDYAAMTRRHALEHLARAGEG